MEGSICKSFFVNKINLFLFFVFSTNLFTKILSMQEETQESQEYFIPQDLIDQDEEQIKPKTKFYDGNKAIHLAVLHGTPEILTRIADHTDNINVINSFGQTALHLAAKRDNPSAVEILLMHGANTNITDKTNQKQTPIFLAIENYSGDATVINMLIAWKADINARDRSGNTPLHLALKMGHYEVARIFIFNPEIKINSVNNNQEKPLDMLLNNVIIKNQENNPKEYKQEYKLDDKDLKFIKISLEKGAESTKHDIKYLKKLTEKKDAKIKNDQENDNSCSII